MSVGRLHSAANDDSSRRRNSSVSFAEPTAARMILPHRRSIGPNSAEASKPLLIARGTEFSNPLSSSEESCKLSVPQRRSRSLRRLNWRRALIGKPLDQPNRARSVAQQQRSGPENEIISHCEGRLRRGYRLREQPPWPFCDILADIHAGLPVSVPALTVNRVLRFGGAGDRVGIPRDLVGRGRVQWPAEWRIRIWRPT